MNPYYNFGDPVSAGEIVDAIPYNIEMESISAGFNLIPPPVQLFMGTLTYASGSGSPNIQHRELTYGFAGPTYIAGEQFAVKSPQTATGIVMTMVNNHGYRLAVFDVYGGSVAGDFIKGGIYSFVFDGINFRVLEASSRYLGPSTRSLDVAESYELTATTHVDSFVVQVNNPVLMEDLINQILYPVNSGELFPVGVNPNTLFTGMVWTMVTDSVADVTGGVLTSTDQNVWIRSA